MDVRDWCPLEESRALRLGGGSGRMIYKPNVWLEAVVGK